MGRHVLRISAVLLLIAGVVVIAVSIVRQRVKGVSLQQRPLVGAISVTDLTVTIGDGRISLTTVVLPAQRFTVRVLDQPERDPSHKSLLAGFGDAAVAINGGYFDEQFDPVGLCIIDGQEISRRL